MTSITNKDRTYNAEYTVSVFICSTKLLYNYKPKV